jgi:hypothetical protein
MITLPLEQRLEILADRARYDVSYSSSGTSCAGNSGAPGSTASSGICHTWTADGRYPGGIRLDGPLLLERLLAPTRRPARQDQLELFASIPDASALTDVL